MFIVNSYALAVLFCFITMLCWGSWGNTQKLAAKSWRYELFYWDYVVGMVIFSLLLAFTMGSFGSEGRHFLPDLAQAESSAIWGIVLGGVIFNASNILLSASTSIAGMSVAFPLGVGLALVLGVINNYIVDVQQGTQGNVLLLAVGVVLVVIAVICNGIASGRRGSSEISAKDSRKGIILAICAGVLMSFFSRFVAAAMDLSNFADPAAGKVTPYTAGVVFALAVFASNFIFNTIVMKKPFVGEPVAIGDYFKGNCRTHLVGMLGGAIWCLGTIFNYIAMGKAGASISYALGQGAPMIAAIWGVFVWKEFKGSGKDVKILLAAMFVLFLAGLGCVVAAGSASPETENDKVQLIFETDMGNDIDDAIALDLIHKYIDEGKVDLLMVGVNKPGAGSVEYVDLMNEWYGHPGIPVGGIDGEQPGGDTSVNYAAIVSDMQGTDGAPLFPREIDGASAPSAVSLYRKTLASIPDASAVIASVGFSTNLVRLMDTPADEFSPLSGKELIAAKVKALHVMAGSFEDQNFSEYNVQIDIPSAQRLFSEWPGQIVVSPFQVGLAITYPGESIENDFSWTEAHPLVEAYKAYLPMPYDRPTWDPTAVLSAVEGQDRFTVSPEGRVIISEDGISSFSVEEGGPHRYLCVTPDQAKDIKAYFVEMVTKKPAGKQ